MTENKKYKDFKDITTIKDSKVVIPFYVYGMDLKLFKELNNFVKRVYKVDSVDSNYIYISIRDYIRICKKVYSENYIFLKTPKTWNNVLDLLRNYLEREIINNGYVFDYSIQDQINFLIKDGFFKYMPFINIKSEGRMFKDFMLGYCCEDCDGKKDDYELNNFKIQITDFIKNIKSKTERINIKITK